MTDRELLELAARAAGLHIKAERVDVDDSFTHFVIGEKNTRERTNWNSLTDDGDALRLAVSLGITPIIRHFGCDATDCYKGMAYERWVKNADDRFLSTRRAITRAAAEIGKAMP